MNRVIDTMYIGTKIRLTNFFDNFFNDENGVSNIVATVLLILVVVLLASIFWDTISKWFTDTWKRIVDSDSIGS